MNSKIYFRRISYNYYLLLLLISALLFPGIFFGLFPSNEIFIARHLRHLFVTGFVKIIIIKNPSHYGVCTVATNYHLNVASMRGYLCYFTITLFVDFLAFFTKVGLKMQNVRHQIRCQHVVKYSDMTSCLLTSFLRKFSPFFLKDLIRWKRKLENVLQYLIYEPRYRSLNLAKSVVEQKLDPELRHLDCRKLKEKKKKTEIKQKFSTAQNPGKQICGVRKCHAIFFFFFCTA